MKTKASDSLYLENIINYFSEKVDHNINSFGFLKYVGEDMVVLIDKINHSHYQIYQSLDLLKAKQNNISKFIVEINKKIYLKNFFLSKANKISNKEYFIMKEDLENIELEEIDGND